MFICRYSGQFFLWLRSETQLIFLFLVKRSCWSANNVTNTSWHRLLHLNERRNLCSTIKLQVNKVNKRTQLPHQHLNHTMPWHSYEINGICLWTGAQKTHIYERKNRICRKWVACNITWTWSVVFTVLQKLNRLWSIILLFRLAYSERR